MASVKEHNDGGPAFPRPMSCNGENEIFEQDGMTLWDHYAGQALIGLLASGAHDCDEGGIAHDAALHADAMMAERETRRGIR